MAQENKPWYRKLRNRYRLVIFNDQTFEERLNFRLTRMNVFVAAVSSSVVLVVLTSLLIALTPLREYIPGYTDVALRRQVYQLNQVADSMKVVLEMNDQYVKAIKRIMTGQEIRDEIMTGDSLASPLDYDTIELKKSAADSLLRIEFENSSRYNLRQNMPVNRPGGSFNFFAPINGVVTQSFNASSNHFGTDIVAEAKEAVKAAQDGTVFIANWTIDNGYVIGLQHLNDYVTFYKHNAVLLNKAGDRVKAGDPIAIIGESGELSTGPHLHFEIWYRGNPVNPEHYVTFNSLRADQ